MKLHIQEYVISRNLNFKINYLFHIHVSKPSRYYNLLFWLFFFLSFCFLFLFLGFFCVGVTAEEWYVLEISAHPSRSRTKGSHFKDAVLGTHYLACVKQWGKKKLTCIFIILNICWVSRGKFFWRKGDWVFLQVKCLLECMFRVF